MGKRFLIIGNEGREHATAWKLGQSSEVEHVFVAYGNAAMLREPKVSRVDYDDYDELARFARQHKIDCTIVGGTRVCMKGIVDVFQKHGLVVLGPTQASAELEGSKRYSKLFMERHGIPTPAQRTFESIAEAKAHLSRCEYPVVLKSDARTSSDVSAVVLNLPLTHPYSSADKGWACAAKMLQEDADNLLLEQCLVGREISYTILMDGADWVSMCPVRDYKRVEDYDQGINTSGLGGYSPVPWFTPDLEHKVVERIVLPTLRGMREENLQYRGFLYFGVLIDAAGDPWLLEYNTRIGDPEAQTTIMLLDEDLADVALRAATGQLGGASLRWRPGCAMTATLAPQGYPMTAKTGAPFALPADEPDDVKYFGGLVVGDGDRYLTRDERAVTATAYAEDASICRQRLYEAVEQVESDVLFWRTDIGAELEIVAEEPAVVNRR
ncbi:MAG: phosphoribosylamine--glycine ligase [Aquisalimonadaceae bacterium]